MNEMTQQRSPRKGDLEIIYNLVWRDGPTVKGDDQSNIVGMYDVPSTTLNWNNFKAYLLKNSGSSTEDVNVYYINEDKEVAIKSQDDYQLALYTFRKRARMNEIITLKLERTDKKEWKDYQLEQVILRTKHLVQMKERETSEIAIGVSKEKDLAPEWFVKYMKKFKKEVVDEVTTAVLNTKPNSTGNHPSHHTRKCKVDGYYKRRSKLHLPSEIQKVSENDGPIGFIELPKIDKPELKMKKLKAKKCVLKVSSDSDAPHYSEPEPNPLAIEALMNATSSSQRNAKVPHCIGSETFMQTWEVINNGKLPWTGETELRYAWGSESLVPVEKKVACPKLQPGESGFISVMIEIPESPGDYECYFHFHHLGRRFGDWLGFQVVVDEPPVRVKVAYSNSPSEMIKSEAPNNKKLKIDNDDDEQFKAVNETAGKFEGLKLDDVKISEVKIPNDLSSDSDNISILSITSSAANNDYVVVDKKSDVEESFEREASIEDDAEFAYIYYKGEKFPFHKKFLSEEYFQRAEKVEDTPGFEVFSNPSNSVELKFDEVQAEDPFGSCTSARKNVSGPTAPPTPFSVEPNSAKFSFVVSDMAAAPSYSFAENEIQTKYSFVDPDKPTSPVSTSKYSFVTCDIPPPEASLNNSSMYSFVGSDLQTKSDSTKYSFESKREYLIPREDQARGDGLTVQAENLNLNGSLKECLIEKKIDGIGEETRRDTNTPPELETAANSSSTCPSLECLDWQKNFQLQQREQLGEQTHEHDSKTHITFHPSEFFEAVRDSLDAQQGTLNTPCESETCEPADGLKAGGSEHSCNSAHSKQQHHHHHHHHRCHPNAAGGNRKQENLISGAAIFASSAMSTARNVMNMVMQNGTWVNGHWIGDKENTTRELNLQRLTEMGFVNRDLNATLLARYNDDLHRVICELIQ